MKRVNVAIAIELDHGYPWHQDCYAGIMKFADEVKWRCIVDPHLSCINDPYQNCTYAGIVGRLSVHLYNLGLERGLPMVNTWVNSKVKEVPAVFPDYSHGSILATRHLYDCGYRRFVNIMFIGDVSDEESQADIEGVASSFSMPCKLSQVPVSFGFEADEDALKDFREKVVESIAGVEKPVGIITPESTSARYVAQICYELGYRVPEDVGIIARKEIYHITESARPYISAIDEDYFAVGYEAAKTLHKIMAMQAVQSIQYIQPRYVVQRESTDIFHCTNPAVRRAILYIRDHLKQMIAVEDIAEHLNISSRTVARYFKQHFGISASEVIARHKIEALKKEFIHNPERLSSIAHDYHFCSPSQMAKYFKKHVGINPREFRSRHLQ